MNRQLYLIITLLLFVCIIIPVAAQKQSKEEKALIAEWKKRMKEMSPLEFKRIVEERDSLLKLSSSFEETQASLKTQIDSKDLEITSLKQQVDSLKASGGSDLLKTNTIVLDASIAKVDSTRVDTSVSAPDASSSSEAASSSGSNSRPGRKASPGVVYKVQIGIFKNKKLEKYIYNNKFFNGDIDQDGARKYTLGYFTDYWEADNFKKYMRAMGVYDAWIVAYKDGNRVNIKDVLEGAL